MTTTEMVFVVLGITVIVGLAIVIGVLIGIYISGDKND